MEKQIINSFNMKKFEEMSYLFNTGNYYDCYLTLGSHKEVQNGKEGFRFTVWAPHAEAVSLVSDCTDWFEGKRMEKVGHTEMWSVFCDSAKEGQPYKYRIQHQDGTVKLKIDPQALEYEVRPKDASVIKELPQKKWRDGLWMASKKRFPVYERPLNIYEVHMSSWKRHEDGTWYSIPELQRELIPYVKEMGYTHIEFLPLMEHPLDASWGYQATGYFALSSKFGTLEDMQDFVEAAHLANIGVLMDWVPSHYNKNDYGMAYFDGTPQYEYQNYHQAQNYRWGTLNFDLGKPQIHSFLISNALFWIEQLHLDGLRVDAVSNMLYLDYDEGEWIPNDDGSNHNREGVKFLQKMNTVIFERHPETLMIAEESTAWSKVTKPVEQGGLGFNYKWNMGWMNDTLRFFEMNPALRKQHFNLLTFSFMYMFNENYVLPFSHDEVVHGKKSLMHKMFGDRYNQFAGLRTLEAFRMTHPGKKLGFMGNEYGQFLEWKFDSSLEWNSLDDAANNKHLQFSRTLNQIYKENKALWELDHDPKGIEILDADNASESIMTYIRKGKKPRDFLIIICNFVPVERQNYRVGVPFEGQYEELLNTEMEELGGTWTETQGTLKTEKKPHNNQEYSINLIVPAMSVIILKPKRIFKVPKV
ncbi:1,4-alpha-glucan branching protein GlgB [Desemzia sp. FAM 23991]|uniref:1,4-alpha-glucan branching protein GlgB n=1 Tax=unclassified Desemzia TaxID=2685243 RepID=UPI0038898212